MTVIVSVVVIVSMRALSGGVIVSVPGIVSVSVVSPCVIVGEDPRFYLAQNGQIFCDFETEDREREIF